MQPIQNCKVDSNNQMNRKRVIDLTKKPPPFKKQKIDLLEISDEESMSPLLRIPKKKSDNVAFDDDDIKIKEMEKDKNTDEGKNDTNEVDDDSDEIVIGTKQHTEYKKGMKRREKHRRKLYKKKKLASHWKYPIKMKIKHVRWRRQYAPREKRYFWVRKTDPTISSWNPWADAGLKAPWVKRKNAIWNKWPSANGDDNHDFYYHNIITNKSQYSRPDDYASPEEIEYDSANDWCVRKYEKIYDDPHNDDDITVVGIVHHTHKKRKKSQREQREERVRSGGSAGKSNGSNSNKTSRRSEHEHFGGFSFKDLIESPKNLKNIKIDSAKERKHQRNRKSSSSSTMENVIASNLTEILTNTTISKKEKEKENELDGSNMEKSKKKATKETEKALASNIDIDDIIKERTNQNQGVYDEQAITEACWAVLEKELRKEPSVQFADLIEAHASGWRLEESVLKLLKLKYNQCVVDMFHSRSETADTNKITKNKWQIMVDNLRGIYKSNKEKAMNFIISVFESKDRDETAKCLSLISQNKKSLETIMQQMDERFVVEFTKIISFVMDCDLDMFDDDMLFEIFGLEFIYAYFDALIKYENDDKVVLMMITKLCDKCIVYQLVASTFLNDIMNGRWYFHKLLSNKKNLKLALEVLKLVFTITKGMSNYKYESIHENEKNSISLLKSDITRYIPNGFSLDTLYSSISYILRVNLINNDYRNYELFEVCCNIIQNVCGNDPPLCLHISGPRDIKSKRIIYLLHKTYTDIENDQLRQPYEFIKYPIATFDPYVEVNITEREDQLTLSNIDIRQSIGDILLFHIEHISGYHRTDESDTFDWKPFKLCLANLFVRLLATYKSIQCSWGYNKCRNHYHRNSILIDWMKQELLFQHSTEGRFAPHDNNQPVRHFRICYLIEMLFDPFLWDSKRQTELLERLCLFCKKCKEECNDNVRLLIWDRIEKSWNKNQEIPITTVMNPYVSNLWSEIHTNCRLIELQRRNNNNNNNKNDKNDKNNDRFLELLSEFCGAKNSDDCDDISALCVSFENSLRKVFCDIINNEHGSQWTSNHMISLFLRSNTLHLLVGITQMEASCVRTRNCARRAIRCLIWCGCDKFRRLLSKSQLPFLPTINHEYETYDCVSELYTKEEDILVVGDGNLSFGRALARIFGQPKSRSKKGTNNGACNVMVTCYESAMELLQRFPHSGGMVAEITDRGATVLYGVDATDLDNSITVANRLYSKKNSMNVESKKWDIIVWNFPHAMNRSYLPKVNGDLVENFFKSAKCILSETGQIHVTLHVNQVIDERDQTQTQNKTKYYHQYDTWGIADRARKQKLACVKQKKLNRRQYPGYAIKNVQGNPFNIVMADTYIFKRVSR